MSAPLVSIKNLEFAYHKQVVLSDVSLSVFERDFIGIIGPNGGGKTTLIKAILGLLKPQKGSVEHSLEKSEIGYLPQGSHVDESFPITVREVVASGLEHGLRMEFRKAKSRQSKVIEALERVGMAALKSRPVGELSGGEFQRTLLARAIISSEWGRMAATSHPYVSTTCVATSLTSKTSGTLLTTRSILGT